MKILLVDDNTENIDMMSIMLKSRNYEVESASNGKEALEKLRSDQYNLIISDILMPVMDGFQFCRECMKDPGLKKIYFIFYTATYVDKKDEEFALSIGARQFIRKPQEPETFLKIVHDIVESSEKEKYKMPEIKDDEEEVLKLYSQRLVEKLEKKNLELKQEIDSHKKTEERLKESEERFSLAVDGTMDGLWDWNIKTGYVYYSERYAQMLDYTTDELPHNIKDLNELIHPDDKKSALQIQEEYLAGKTEVYETTYRMKTKNNSYIWINARGKAVFDKNGKPYRFVGFHTDITEKKEQEIELIKAKERAEESDKLKSAFLTNLSHEVRTPMNGIMGFINLLKNPNLESFKQEEYLQIIIKSCNQLLSIITNIVEISKLDAKQVFIKNEQVNINKVFDTVYATLSQKVENNNDVSLVMNIHPDLENVVLITDKVKLIQILTNLIANSIKFTHKGIIEFGCRINNLHEIEFYVKDTGIGIDHKYHSIIFDKFRQADIMSEIIYEGLGLGLTISKEYVELLGGKIWFDSAKDKGSTFNFTIPGISSIENKPSIKENTNQNITKDFSGKVILIAEDDDNNYALLKELLTDKNIKALRAETGKKAVELCKGNPHINLVLMDIKLPELNGYEATKQILDFNKNIPVIAQTAYAFLNDKQKALDIGCVDYIAKPISNTQLMAILEKYL